MKFFFILLGSLVAVGISGGGTGLCHGVDGYVGTGSARCIEAMYDDGEPMSYAAVKIMAPDSAVEFQTGRTDRNGYFMVKPDAPGNWQAVISDGMGHRLALEFTVAPEQKEEAPSENPSENAATPRKTVNRPMGVVAGLSIIFGLSGLAFGWNARRKHGA